MLRSDFSLPAGADGSGERAVKDMYSDAVIIEVGNQRRKKRLTKTVLWNLYFQLSVLLIEGRHSMRKLDYKDNRELWGCIWVVPTTLREDDIVVPALGVSNHRPCISPLPVAPLFDVIEDVVDNLALRQGS